MTPQNAQATIAYYMGYTINYGGTYYYSPITCAIPQKEVPYYTSVVIGGHKPTEDYTKSLDSLIPVWEKMGVTPTLCLEHKSASMYVNPELIGKPFGNMEFYTIKGETIQEAAAMVTAKVIEDLI